MRWTMLRNNQRCCRKARSVLKCIIGFQLIKKWHLYLVQHVSFEVKQNDIYSWCRRNVLLLKAWLTDKVLTPCYIGRRREYTSVATLVLSRSWLATANRLHVHVQGRPSDEITMDLSISHRLALKRDLRDISELVNAAPSTRRTAKRVRFAEPESPRKASHSLTRRTQPATAAQGRRPSKKQVYEADQPPLSRQAYERKFEGDTGYFPAGPRTKKRSKRVATVFKPPASSKQFSYKLPATTQAQETLSRKVSKDTQLPMQPGPNANNPFLPQRLHDSPDAGMPQFKLPEFPTKAQLKELRLTAKIGEKLQPNQKLFLDLCPRYFKNANADSEATAAMPEWIRSCPNCKNFRLENCKALKFLDMKAEWRGHPHYPYKKVPKEAYEAHKMCNACGLKVRTRWENIILALLSWGFMSIGFLCYSAISAAVWQFIEICAYCFLYFLSSIVTPLQCLLTHELCALRFS